MPDAHVGVEESRLSGQLLCALPDDFGRVGADLEVGLTAADVRQHDLDAGERFAQAGGYVVRPYSVVFAHSVSSFPVSVIHAARVAGEEVGTMRSRACLLRGGLFTRAQ